MRLLLERQDVEPDSKDNDGQTPRSWSIQRSATVRGWVTRLLCGCFVRPLLCGLKSLQMNCVLKITMISVEK